MAERGRQLPGLREHGTPGKMRAFSDDESDDSSDELAGTGKPATPPRKRHRRAPSLPEKAESESDEDDEGDERQRDSVRVRVRERSRDRERSRSRPRGLNRLHGGRFRPPNPTEWRSFDARGRRQERKQEKRKLKRREVMALRAESQKAHNEGHRY